MRVTHNLCPGLVRQLSDEPVKVEGPTVGEGVWILLQDVGETQGILLVPATILQARWTGEGGEGGTSILVN